MVDPEDARLKAEIDEISAKISDTLKKIEQVVPSKKKDASNDAAERGAD